MELRGALLQAAIFIKNYLKDTNKKCFTYRGLRAWWSKNRKYKNSEWHTVERAIRSLAAQGYLRRRVYGRRVVFCPTPFLLYVFDELDKIIVSRGVR